MKNTQNARLIRILLASKNHSITSLEAAQLDKPIMRLSERIRELEAEGVYFVRTQEKTVDGNGQYTRYKLQSIENYNPRNSADHPYADSINDTQLAIL
jgi:predicted transcriptional regulator